MYGDGPNNGGHAWPGNQGKSLFPVEWSTEKTIHEVGDIATSPNTRWYAQTGTGGYIHPKETRLNGLHMKLGMECVFVWFFSPRQEKS
nr:EndoU domain-containing protein [Chitiniphilus shinanonensis]